MREKWNLIYSDLGDIQEILEELLGELPQSPHFQRRAARIKRLWSKMQYAIREFDNMVTPIPSLPVKMPFTDEKVRETWVFWKDYLSEQHGITLKSRAEIQSLKRLNELSDSDPHKAVRILEFASSCGYKNFFAVPEGANQKPMVYSTEEIKY